MKNKEITFQNKKGQTLSAKLEIPQGEVIGYALFAHCFTCNKNLSAVRNISKALNNNNIAVLRFDFTGLGESEGDFKDTNFSSNIDDLIAAADYLEKENKAPSIIIGHSLGGAAVVFAANKITSIKAVVTIGAPSDPEHVSHLFESGIEEIQKTGKATLNIGGRPFTIEKQFIEDISQKNMKQALQILKKPILILHSPQDTTVEIKNASEIYQASWHPKSFISLDGADHLLTNRQDSIYAGKVIATWAERYITL